MDLTSLEDGCCGGEEEASIDVVGEDDEDSEGRKVDAGDDDTGFRFACDRVLKELPDDDEEEAAGDEEEEYAETVAGAAVAGVLVGVRFEFPTTGSGAETIIISVIQTKDFPSFSLLFVAVTAALSEYSSNTTTAASFLIQEQRGLSPTEFPVL